MEKKDIALRIAQLRTKKGVSARDMSLSIGQNENYINRIENDISLPSLRGLILICEYFGITLKEFFDVENKIHDYLLISAALRTFFYNHVEYDYSMKTFYEGNIQSLQIVKSCKELSDVLHKIVEFKNREHKGIDVYADYRMKDNVLLERNILKVKQEAKRFYEDRILVKVKKMIKYI